MPRSFLICLLLMLCMNRLSAQLCDNGYYAMTFKGSLPNTITRSVLSKDNNLVTVGNIRYFDNNLYRGFGWVTKMTKKGTILWSRKFANSVYTYLQLTDIAEADDESFFAVGHTADTIGSVQFTKVRGVLLHIDKYGNLLSSQTLNSFVGTEQVMFTSILRTTENAMIIDGVTSYAGGANVKGFSFRRNPSGAVPWMTRFASDTFSFNLIFRKHMIETKAGNIITGIIATQINKQNGKFMQAAYYLTSVNKNTGQRNWDKMLLFYDKIQTYQVSDGAVAEIAELSNGNLSFMISLCDSAPMTVRPYTEKTVELITDANGNVLSADQWWNGAPGARTIDGYYFPNGDRIMLIDDGQRSIFMRTDAAHNITAQKAYQLPGQKHYPAAMTTAADGFYIWENDLNDETLFSLLKTTVNADLTCTEVPVNMIPASPSKFKQTAKSEVDYMYHTDSFALPVLTITSEDYAVTSTVDCKSICCTDKTINLPPIKLCDQSSYTLADNAVVTKTGKYYARFTTANGCDSIYYYDIDFLTKPKLSLGADDCLEGKDSVVLKATGGYNTYTWQNGTSTADSHFVVRTPGQYHVQVTNACGTAADSVQVTDKCDYTVYMPNAFTPNGDGRNDFFSWPASNKNKFIALTVYNRWGQIIFQTTDSSVGWDGTLHAKQQPLGSYVYVLITEDVKGKRTTHRGLVTLLR